MSDYLSLLRPRQWLKNVFVFAGLIFSRQFYYPDSIQTSVLAFLVFCTLSSSIYIINDIFDAPADRQHPAKRHRPLARGTIKLLHAWLIAGVLLAISVLGAWLIAVPFFMICVTYIVLMVLYSLVIKTVIILDVLFVAMGYVLRAIAGAVVINVAISSWLLVCTLLLALFLAISKRRVEIVILGDNAHHYRKTLSQYSLVLLDQMTAIVTSACLVSYCLYTLTSETVIKFHTRNLIFTVPFVLYGIFRYLYLTYNKKQTDMPERILFSDIPLMLCLILWVIACIAILTTA
jgi:4-hydroxybenzoate polyprenyltransferase